MREFLKFPISPFRKLRACSFLSPSLRHPLLQVWILGHETAVHDALVCLPSPSSLSPVQLG